MAVVASHGSGSAMAGRGLTTYPSYFKLQVRWLRSFTRITYLSKLIGIHSLAAFLQLELFRV
ncbi:hypothetical protein LF929_004710 [Dickeya oryzae]|uniref:Uncharacterized protein n=1 Tax=Dickeya oryzae TaxID=1240404 RepID=A0AB39IUR0_9GAMM|nr:hypothetical protein [Dickeya oryzae]MCA6992790.1 hypothetical protein [Dickeya oryzae]